MASNFNLLNDIKKVAKKKSIFIQNPDDDSDFSFSETLCIGQNALASVDELLSKKLSRENPHFDKLYNLYSSLVRLEEEAFQGAFLSSENDGGDKNRFKFCYHRYEDIVNQIKSIPDNAIIVDEDDTPLIDYFNPENLQKITYLIKSIEEDSKLSLKNVNSVQFLKAFAKRFNLEKKEFVFDASEYFGLKSLKKYFDIYVQDGDIYAVREAVYGNIQKVQKVKKELAGLDNVVLYIDGTKFDMKKIKSKFFDRIAEMTLHNLCTNAEYLSADHYGLDLPDKDNDDEILFSDIIDEFVNGKLKGQAESTPNTQSLDKPKAKVAAPAKAEHKSISNDQIDEFIEGKFKNIIGLGKVKDELKDMIKLCNKLKAINKFTMAHNHMCFVGRPGTGKTTVARIVADVLYEAGFLSSNKLTEVNGISLKAEYMGQTAPKVQKVIDDSKGGVLFIDEAYQITDTARDDDSYGKEAIATLIKNMEDKKDLMVIFAGYERPTKKMIETNPGLASRINGTIKFDDYSEDELIQIAKIQGMDSGFQIDVEAESKLREYFKEQKAKPNFANGRCARNIINMAERFQTRRAGMGDFTLTEEDITLAIEAQNKRDAENEQEKIAAVKEEAARRASRYMVDIEARQEANQRLIEQENKGKRKHIGLNAN